MQVKILIIIGIALIVSSCSITKSNQAKATRNNAQKQFQSNYIFTDDKQIAYFECDDFVNNALNSYTVASLNKKYNFLHAYRQSIENMHNPAIIDTIYTFSNSKNKIEIYRAQYRDFVFTFDVTSPKIKLPGNINPHMRKINFLQNFHMPQTTTDKIQIANSDSTMKFLFYFEKKRLKRITTFIYLD